MPYHYNNEVSIVIPVYNEQENISPLMQEITTSMPAETTYEVIIVDDASKDETWKVLQELQSKYNMLHIIKHAKNYGQTAALFTGIKKTTYSWVISMDGDGQNDPRDIVKLINTLKNTEQFQRGVLIAGHRVHRQDNRLKKISSRIANNVRRAVLHDRCNDTGCSLKLFPRDAILSLPCFNHFHRFIPAMLETLNIPTLNIAVNHRNREFGVSKYGLNNRLWVGIADMFGVRWLKNRYITNIETVELHNHTEIE